MAITNPERVATKQDLKDFYDIIFPYLGGNAEAGFTPIGTIIAVMGKTAPTNYLACNGQIVNIADYPELANYFKAQFGSYNYFGGNGTTTFAICDLRGEFLRGTGTNSHSNQGSGSDVGTHQDATKIPYFGKESGYTNSQSRLFAATKNDRNFPTNMDYQTKKSDNSQSYWYTTGTATDESGYNYPYIFTPRPTNTSVLYCIATKNIYLNPSLSFSTEEQVVGTWINGKTIYQRVASFTYGNIGETSGAWVNLVTIPNWGATALISVDLLSGDTNLRGSAIANIFFQISGNTLQYFVANSVYNASAQYAIIRYLK